MVNRLLLLPAVAAEALDTFTINWALEGNPIVLFLGPWAYLGKLGIVLLLLWLVLNVRDHRTTAVLLFAIVIGLFGAYTNLNGGIG